MTCSIWASGSLVNNSEVNHSAFDLEELSNCAIAVCGATTSEAINCDELKDSAQAGIVVLNNL